jgi:hypothetical protein
MMRTAIASLVLLVCLWASSAWAAIAHDATTPGTEVTSGTTHTTSHTTAAGSNRLIKVVVTWDTTGGLTVSGVTYNGVALSSLAQCNTPFGSKAVQLWYLVAPATGANNVVVTQSNTIVGMNAQISTYTGVDQGSPVGTAACGNDFAVDPATVNANSTADGLVVDGIYSQTGISVGAGQTQRGNDSETWVTASSEEAGTGAAVTMSWTGPTGLWAISAVNLNAAASGGACSGALTLRGVGGC